MEIYLKRQNPKKRVAVNKMIKSATLAASEMITPTKIITSATLPARFSFLVAISTIFHSAVIESHYLNG